MSFNPSNSFSGTIRINVTGLRESIAGVNNLLREWPQTKTNIIRESSLFFFRDAQKNAHVITGKTKASIHIESVTQQQGIIAAGFGMPFEEKRGGTRLDVGTSHKTFSTTARTTADQMPIIIKKNFDELLRKNRTP